MTRSHHLAAVVSAAVALSLAAPSLSANESDWSPGPPAWVEDLTPITAAEWNYDRAEHLLERAGFGGTPEDVAKLAAMTPEEAVRSLVYYDDIPNDHLPPF